MRSSVRFPRKVNGKIVLLMDGRKVSGSTVNYSRGGMLLQTSKEYQIGDRISFEWYTTRSPLLAQQYRSVDAVVRWKTKEHPRLLDIVAPPTVCRRLKDRTNTSKRPGRSYQCRLSCSAEYPGRMAMS